MIGGVGHLSARQLAIAARLQYLEDLQVGSLLCRFNVPVLQVVRASPLQAGSATDFPVQYGVTVALVLVYWCYRNSHWGSLATSAELRSIFIESVCLHSRGN